MDAAINFAGKVLELTVEPIGRQFGYLFFHNGNVRELKDEVKKLQGQRDSLQHEVDEARRNVEKIEDNVQHWLTRVREITELAEKFYEEESQAKTECSMRSCPNPWPRYRLSKKAKKITLQVIKLKQDRNNFNRISYREAVAPRWLMTYSTSFSRGNEAFDSRVSTMNEIMDALADPTINKIGLYGLGGVGKSTMAGEAAVKAEREKLFDRVVMVVVARNPDYKRIQKEIGEVLGLKLDEESEFARAGRLCERLKQEKNVLVILDDLWERLDLGKLGIPSAVDYEGNKMGINSSDGCKGCNCKIMLISRDAEVLSNQMNCKKTIMLGDLTEKEAWELFKEMSEVQVDSNLHLQYIATEVAKECAGLPIAIVTVARALRNKSLSEWRNALAQLQNPTRRDVTGWRKEVYAPIQLSHGNLENEELKSIFLLSSMLYDDLFTLDLFKYCIGLDVFEGTMEDARDSLDTLISKLKASCLFSNGSSNDRFMMHDIVRDTGLSILSSENRALAVRYDKLDKWPENKQFENYEWICFLRSDLGMLPEKLSCPSLRFFHLVNKGNDVIIPDGFFKELHELRVMDLTGVNLPFLPNSITQLENLRTLCLDDCVLGDISMIGKLKTLKALSLIGSTIQQLPRELGELTQLQLIDLTGCSKLEIIPPNVISKLEKLEVIYLERSFNQWQYQESNYEKSANAKISELMDLPNLSTLHFHIPHASMLQKDMFTDRLKKYRILIGDVWEWKGKYGSLRTLKLKLNTSIHSETYGVKKLMDRVEDLFLDEVKGIKNVLNDLNKRGFLHLKHLQIQNNSQIEYIINLRQVHVDVAFPNLETLVLENMIQLEKLCDGQLPVNSFSKLTVIKVRNCNKLNSLFSVSLVRSLPKLDEIEIFGCKLMQEIVDLSDQEIDDEGILEFYQLRILTMSSLPALVSFCLDDKRSLATAPCKEKQFESASNSNVIPKEDKPNPSQHLFSDKVAFPSLDTLILSAINIQNIWHDSISTCSWVQNLTDLSVKGCQSLHHIMPIAVATSFVKLKHLKICECDMVEMIIFPTPNATHTSYSEEVIFPSLETMVISHMENLQAIWHNHSTPNSYGKIKKVEISYCEKLITIVPSHMLRTLSHLETLAVGHCGSLDTIFDFQGVNVGESHSKLAMHVRDLSLCSLSNLRHIWNNDSYSFMSFGGLQTVHAYKCESLRSIFPASIAKHLPQLEVLEISCCAGVKVIVERDEVAGAAPCFVFPQLSSLTLWNLPNLKNFYPERHTSEWPQLRELKVYLCDNLDVFETKVSSTTETEGNDEDKTKYPLCLIEKVIPSLKVLTLNPKAITKIKNGEFQDDLFHNVKALYLESFLDNHVSFPYDFLQRSPNTEQLYVYTSLFEELFPGQLPLGAHLRKIAPFKNLTLSYLTKLKNIWNEDHQPEQVQNLESLEVTNCDALISLAPSSASFDNLIDLKVSGCHQLIHLVTSSTAKTLVHLMRLKITDCKLIDEIVTNKEENVGNTIAMQKLEYLELIGLSSLKAFCSSKSYTLVFPSLYQVIVKECPRLNMFCAGFLDTPILERVEVEENGIYWNNDLNKTIENLFGEKVAFRSMEKMKLVEYPELTDIWEGKLPNWSFNSLKSLIVENCEFLSDVIPSYLLNSLGNLEELEVRDCNSVEAVFDLQDIKEPHTLPQLRLKTITLSHLPKVKSVWNKDPQQIDFRQHLWKVKVYECGSLRSIFPASIARHLPKLEVLDIDSCIGVEVIVEKDEVAGVVPCFQFPQLHTLMLWKLPNLKNFYPETHTSEWPQLRDLKVYMCENVEVFGSEIPGTTETQEKDKLTEARHPLFFVEKVVPNLKELVLNQKAVMMIRNGQFPTDLFHKVKLLNLESFNDEPITFPCSFLERFPNLNELHVCCSSFEEIFPSQGAIGNNLGKYAPLKILELAYLEQLKNIWHGDSQLELVLQNLEGLKVEYCSRLMNLAPSAALFDSLTKLDVSGCHQLIYLVTSSTAKSLVHLTTLKINDCKMIEEIISDEGENEEKEILFKKLESLELTGLPNLESFCSQDYKFKFPSLDKVTVRGCPNLKKFCPGVLTTPLLQDVRVEENKKHWESDLNKTIEQLFLKKDGQNSSEC